MNTAIIHEWLVNYAGSEKCVESFTNIWPEADVFTLVDYLNEDQRKFILKGKQSHTSFIQKLPFSRSRHRNYLALFPLAIEQFDLSDYDLVFSSSHAVAKGVLTNSNQLHITYCHTPMRYAWYLYHRELSEAGLDKGFRGLLAKRVLHYIRMWDIISANRVDYFIANSNNVARRIRKLYRREADVIHPPVDTKRFQLSSDKEDYYVTASRLVPYKRMDLLVDAFSKLPDKKLVVIGNGPELNKLKSKATKNVEILGYQPHDSLVNYMKHAKAFLFAADEDFGIVVLEAMACGTPVIALNKGGTAETVINGKTGVLFDYQTVDSIISGIKEFEKKENSFDSVKLREYAEQFSREIFEEKITTYVKNKCDHFFNKSIL